MEASPLQVLRWLLFFRHLRRNIGMEDAYYENGDRWRLERLNLRIGGWLLLDWIWSGWESCGFTWYDGWYGWYLRRDKVDGYWTDCTLFVCPVPFFPFACSWSWAWRREYRADERTKLVRRLLNTLRGRA